MKDLAVAVRKCLARGLQVEEQSLKITLELDQDILDDVRQRTGSSDLPSITAFISSVVRNEVGRPDRDLSTGVDASLAAMVQQIEALREGQRTLFQLIDRAATILSRQVTNVGAKARNR